MEDHPPELLMRGLLRAYYWMDESLQNGLQQAADDEGDHVSPAPASTRPPRCGGRTARTASINAYPSDVEPVVGAVERGDIRAHCPGDHLLVQRFAIHAETYADTFLKASQADLISADLAQRLLPAAGLRNRLVHDYDALDPERIHAAIQTALTDLGDLLNELRAAGMGI